MTILYLASFYLFDVVSSDAEDDANAGQLPYLTQEPYETLQEQQEDILLALHGSAEEYDSAEPSQAAREGPTNQVHPL